MPNLYPEHPDANGVFGGIADAAVQARVLTST